MMRRPVFVLLGLLIAGGPVASADELRWSDTFVQRLEVLALLQDLDSALLSHDSATLTLDRWCGEHKLADPAKIVAHLRREVDKPATAEQRRLLGVGPEETIRYRRVELVCGTHVLSEADNWYVPARLTPDMNRELDSSDVAFGRAVQPLHFQRHILAAETLWSPLPQGWESHPPAIPASPGKLAIPRQVLQHRALLVTPSGSPISEVVETYTSEVLAFPPPITPAAPADCR